MQSSDAGDFREFAAKLAQIVIASVADNRAGLEVGVKRDGTPVAVADIGKT